MKKRLSIIKESSLTSNDVLELDNRWNHYKNGKLKTYTLDVVKKEVEIILKKLQIEA